MDKEEIEVHQKIDYHYTTIFNCLSNIITSYKPNLVNKIEDQNLLELESSVQVIVNLILNNNFY